MTGPLAPRLALADMVHARVPSLCQVIGLAALLVPLLILFGIKNGVIADRTRALLDNPENLRVSLVGQRLYSAEFLAELAARDDVRFVGPHPIQLAVQADFALPRDGGAIASRVTLLATGRGDPYLPPATPVPGAGQVVLAATTAGALDGAAAGDRIEVLLAPRDGAPDGAVMTLEVVGVLEAGTWGRTGALMAPADLALVQDWVHGTVQGDDLDTLRADYVAPDSVPLIRLYASDVDGAFRLVADLAAQGIPSANTLGAARDLIALRRALDAGFLTVAVVGLFGVTATLSASLWAAIARNRRPLSLLRLGGLGRGDALAFPLTQALAAGLAGWLLSILAYFALTGVLNATLAQSFGVSGQLARLSAAEFGASGAFTFVVSALASVAAAMAATSITPEEGLLDAS